jgi:hypothetical protein
MPALLAHRQIRLITFKHTAPHLPVHGLSFLGKKSVGDNQLPKLGMEVLDQRLFNLRGRPFTAPMKDVSAPSRSAFFH